MDSRRFDALARALVAAGSRRGLLSIASALPFAGGLTALLGAEDADADGRRRRRKKRHKHGKGRHRGGHQKGKKRKKRKGPCGDVCASGCAFTSLQEAIDAAEAGATIRLCAETYGETLTIAKNLTLIGAGDGGGGTILDGEGDGSVVTISSVISVTLEGLRLTGGNTDVGGGISNLRGALVLNGCHVADNTASVQGGGIYINSGTVTLNDSSVTGNEGVSQGGGIYNSFGSTVMLNDSSVTGNKAVDGQQEGGGIYNAGTVTLNGTSSVTDNEAGDEGGGIYNNLGTVTLNEDSSVTQNEPDNCAGSGTYSGNDCGP